MEEIKNKAEVIEDNPFEDPQIANQWINSVENEHDMIRDKEIYPMLEDWVENIKPKTIIDIGSGQGICADYVHIDGSKYLGIEPSAVLVERAEELYPKSDRGFILGNAYEIPVSDNSVDAAISINVLFHLQDLDLASKELSRVLKPGGHFLINTANPKYYDVWKEMYFDAVEDEEKIDGKVNVPINPLSRNVLFKHRLEKIRLALVNSDLLIDSEEELGFIPDFPDKPIFVCFKGHKKIRN